MNKKEETCIWTGVNGTEFLYTIFELPVSFNPEDLGNYIYTKTKNSHWTPIYIGEGKLCERCSDQHHKAEDIKSKGATHIHIHLNPNSRSRYLEEEYLLANYPEAYAPIGCNEREGG